MEFVQDRGDFVIKDYFDIEELVHKELALDRRVLCWGGDHSITFPVMRAFSKVYSDINILLIDAHADLYDEFEGDPYSHACPFARIMEEKLAVRLVEVGIRSINPHQRNQAKKFGVEMIEMKDYDFARIPNLKGPLYLSIDLDGIDPGYAPGVTHQEAGGLSSREVIRIIQNIKVPLIGADIVEYNPQIDVNGITCALAGKLTQELIARMLA
jgi:agmatinase